MDKLHKESLSPKDLIKHELQLSLEAQGRE